MHVFITGATGWVGSAVVEEMLANGHDVTGLVRSDDKASVLDVMGAKALRGTLDDIELLRTAAASCDAVIHTAFNHDFAKFAENAEQDRRAIEVMGDAIAGSSRPMLVTSGVALLAPGRVAREDDLPTPDPTWPRKSESMAIELGARGVHVSTIRLAPSVHGVGDHGFLSILIALAREKKVSAYIGDGTNRWPAVHRLDAGRLYRLALERGTTESAYHGVAEEGIAMRDIATVIGRRLGLPVEARPADHFGWFARFAQADMPASSALTQSRLGWLPTEVGLIDDIDQPAYFAN